MKTIDAYMGNGKVSFVTLDKDIKALQPDQVKMDKEKLEKILVNEKEKNSEVCGIIDTTILRIVLKSNSKYSCRIWSARQTITGTYK